MVVLKINSTMDTVRNTQTPFKTVLIKRRCNIGKLFPPQTLQPFAYCLHAVGASLVSLVNFLRLIKINK